MVHLKAICSAKRTKLFLVDEILPSYLSEDRSELFPYSAHAVMYVIEYTHFQMVLFSPVAKRRLLFIPPRNRSTPLISLTWEEDVRTRDYTLRQRKK